MRLNCSRCHHAGEVHLPSAGSRSGLGRCNIPGCACSGYHDGIGTIDEDLL